MELHKNRRLGQSLIYRRAHTLVHFEIILRTMPLVSLQYECAMIHQCGHLFPNCVGSIDGKHVTIKSPPNSGSNYFCYLKKFSIVLLAVVGPDYKFIGYGKNSDGGILEESLIVQKLSNNLLNIPSPKPLLERTIPTPHVLIGDEAFALKTYLMRPFPRRSRQCVLFKYLPSISNSGPIESHI